MLVAGSVALRAGAGAMRRGTVPAGPLLAALVLNLMALALLLALALVALQDPGHHARDALRAVLAGYVGLHVLIGAGFTGFVWWQARQGEITPERRGALANTRLWQDFTAATGLIAAAVAFAQGGMA